MKSLSFIYLTFTLVYLTSCGPQSAKTNDDQPEVLAATASSETEANNANDHLPYHEQVSTEMPEFYSAFPAQVAAENQRFVDSNNILHIDFLGSRLQLNESRQTLEQLFPDCSLEMNPASTEIFDVYNVTCQNSPYTAVVTYEQTLDNEYVIAYIYVKNEPFSMQLIEKLFE